MFGLFVQVSDKSDKQIQVKLFISSQKLCIPDVSFITRIKGQLGVPLTVYYHAIYCVL